MKAAPGPPVSFSLSLCPFAHTHCHVFSSPHRRTESLNTTSLLYRDHQAQVVVAIVRLICCHPYTLSYPTIFSSKPPSPSELAYSPPSPRRIEDIGRPKQLRKARHHADPSSQTHFINRLPVEILALIFLSGSEDDIFFPITVSHVCRTWRHIALRTPALWRRITLSPKERMWKERIRRARACSLDVQLLPVKSRSRRDEPEHPELDPYSIQWHMHIVLPYINRWRSLEIVFPESGPYLWKAALARVCSRSGAQAPLLEDLKLVYKANDDPEVFTLFSGIAPNLRSATLNGIRLNWLPSLFANLTFLDYTHHGFTAGHRAVEDVIQMLRVSSELVHLRLGFPRKAVSHSSPSQQEPSSKHVVLRKLKFLQLRVEGKDIPFELARLATLIVTPSLTSLHLVDNSRSYNSFASLKSFFYIYALPPSLCSVKIEHGWYDPRMVTPIVQSHLKVRQISIKRLHLPEQTINVKPSLAQSHSASQRHRSRKVSQPARLSTARQEWASERAPPIPIRKSNSGGPGTGDRQVQIQRIDVQYFKAWRQVPPDVSSYAIIVSNSPSFCLMFFLCFLSLSQPCWASHSRFSLPRLALI